MSKTCQQAGCARLLNRRDLANEGAILRFPDFCGHCGRPQSERAHAACDARAHLLLGFLRPESVLPEPGGGGDLRTMRRQQVATA